jgi:hypothetical protein
VLAIALGGLLPTTPMWLRGMTDAGDAVFHAMWYTNFARQFFAGEAYPRWLAEMNGGLGSPVFFYAPLPYYLTLLFTPFLPGGVDDLRSARLRARAHARRQSKRCASRSSTRCASRSSARRAAERRVSGSRRPL